MLSMRGRIARLRLKRRCTDKGKKERPSFLEKRSKKLLFLETGARTTSRQDAKVFWFFFSKKNCFLPEA
jgi:hypothetical protein